MTTHSHAAYARTHHIHHFNLLLTRTNRLNGLQSIKMQLQTDEYGNMQALETVEKQSSKF